ncbi:hypothetical protein [Aeromicrobium chenweiae]|nr:hypothetical protein [Aeromicrobium chenweiae]TGN33006.1 hypothetical protein E4L97_10030 [Aeromicrobium chenweiae]
MTEKTTKESSDAPILPWQIWIGSGVVLAGVGGVVFYQMSKNIAGLEDPVGSFLPGIMAVAGILLGAGFGLILGDFRMTKTTETTTKDEDIDTQGLAEGAILEESFKVLKDLTPGKTLLVLAVALVGLSLWAVTPSKPDVQVNVPASASPDQP